MFKGNSDFTFLGHNIPNAWPVAVQVLLEGKADVNVKASYGKPKHVLKVVFFLDILIFGFNCVCFF